GWGAGGGGREVESARRPAAIPARRALAVGLHLKSAPGLGCGARRPRRDARRVGRIGGRPGARGAERDETDPARRPPCWPAAHENLMSAVRSNRPPVVSRNSTLSGPGARAPRVKEKKGFSATPCEVSKVRMVLPRYVTITLLT